MKNYYDKKDLKNTPSIKHDNLDYATECRYRKEGARFIVQLGSTLVLGHNTVATGVVYFHRFYMFHSFKQFPRYVTACCCLFLAGKVEETPKKCKDIIKVARDNLPPEKFASFGEGDAKEEVMTLERILLQTIKFDLQVEHPYNYLLKYAKCLKGDSGKIQKMVQMAWNFVNDSLSTTVCLQWEPEIIAVALIYLASKLSKFTVTDWVGRKPEHLKWWDMFVQDVTMEILEDICHQVLDLYQQQTNDSSSLDSPPQQPPSKTSPSSAKRHSNFSSPNSSTKSSPTVTAPTIVKQPPQPALTAAASAPPPPPNVLEIETVPVQAPPSIPAPAVPPPQADPYNYNNYQYPPYGYGPPYPTAIVPPPVAPNSGQRPNYPPSNYPQGNYYPQRPPSYYPPN